MSSLAAFPVDKHIEGSRCLLTDVTRMQPLTHCNANKLCCGLQWACKVRLLKCLFAAINKPTRFYAWFSPGARNQRKCYRNTVNK